MAEQPSEIEYLLARIRNGDEDALLALHERYAGPVFAVAYRILNNRMSAEEVTQDTFMRIWEKGHTYDARRGDFLPWLLSIARRRAIDVLRQRRRRQPVYDATFSLDEHPYLWEQIPGTDTDYELRRTLAGVMATLPEEQRKVLALAYFYGLSHSEIADYLDQPLGTVKTRIRLGMEKLRDAWLAVESNPIPGSGT